MDTIILAAPILPEKTEAWRRFCQEIMGRRRDQHERSRQALAIAHEAAWLASTPNGSMAIIALEASDIEATWHKLATSPRPFDRWFRRRVLEIHGLDLSRPLSSRADATAFQWQSSPTRQPDDTEDIDDKSRLFTR